MVLLRGTWYEPLAACPGQPSSFDTTLIVATLLVAALAALRGNKFAHVGVLLAVASIKPHLSGLPTLWLCCGQQATAPPQSIHDHAFRYGGHSPPDQRNLAAPMVAGLVTHSASLATLNDATMG